MKVSNKTIQLGRLFEGDKVIWMVLLFLCITSVLEVYSASSNMSYQSGAFWKPVMGHMVTIVLGVIVAWVVHKIPCRYFGWIVVVGPLLSVVMLITALLTSATVNGSARWFDIWGISFQPSEIAKGSLIVVVAWLLSVMRDKQNKATPSAFKWIAAFSLVICGLIVPENFSTAALTALVVLLMMIVGQVPWKPLGIVLGIVAITGSIGYSTLKFSSEETIQSLSELPMLHRLPTWAHRLNNHSEFPENPDSFDLATNPQITQAHVAIATCNIIGKGPGNSTVRDFLPQAYSDFIYAIIIEELGLWGGTLVLLMYLILLYRAARIASRCEKNFPAFLIMGLALLIATQAMVNMSVAVGLAPVTGQPLPLVSRGGSSILMNCAYLGMMLSISRTARQRADDSQPVPSTPKQ